MDVGSVLLVVATLGTGLVAGLFVAFSVAVMPGLRATNDAVFVATTQRVNVAIVNPLFLVLFLGSPVLLAAATFVGPRNVFLVLALLLHLAGLAITPTLNIPLNNALDVATDPGPARTSFEAPWNRAHTLRTVLMLASFALCMVAMGY